MIFAYIALVIAAMLWWSYTEKISRTWLFHLLHGSLVALLTATFHLLPATCEPAREFTFVAAGEVAALWLYQLAFRLLESRRLRRISKQRAARPLQQHLCTAATTPCALSFEELRAHLHELPGTVCHDNRGTIIAVSETVDNYFDIWATPLPTGGWLLTLHDDQCDAEDLYTKELTHILALHNIAPSLCPTHLSATTLAICRNGQLHTYPAGSNLRAILNVE